MSRFTTPAVLEMLDDYRWRLMVPFEFWLTDAPDDVIRGPAGYVCRCQVVWPWEICVSPGGLLVVSAGLARPEADAYTLPRYFHSSQKQHSRRGLYTC